MTAEEKKAVKGLLRRWGSYTKAIREQNGELAQFKKACIDIERVQNENNQCRIIPIDSLKSRAEKLGCNINRQFYLKTELDEIINTMPFEMQSVLRARYVKCIPWEYIPANLPAYMSERQCYRLHRQALEIISRNFNYLYTINPISC